jgi:hypothetical protein
MKRSYVVIVVALFVLLASVAYYAYLGGIGSSGAYSCVDNLTIKVVYPDSGVKFYRNDSVVSCGTLSAMSGDSVECERLSELKCDKRLFRSYK